MFSSAHQIILATRAWLRTRRTRCLFLLVCSPVLLPLLCATFPILCVRELFRHRGRRKEEFSGGEERLRMCEEGVCDCGVDVGMQIGLLHRYLEDQLILVGSVYECGDEHDHHTPLLG